MYSCKKSKFKKKNTLYPYTHIPVSVNQYKKEGD